MRVALAEIADCIDSSFSRGRESAKALGHLIDELDGNVPQYAFYEGSEFEKLIELRQLLSASEVTRLKARLLRDEVYEPRKLFSKTGIWLWRSTVEDAVLQPDGAEDIAERILIEKRVISGALQPAGRSRRLRQILSNRSNSSALSDVVAAIYADTHYARCELRACCDYLSQL